MVALNIQASEIGIYLAILLRISIVLFMIPIFASPQVPRVIKIFIALALTGILYFVLQRTVTPLPFELAALVRITIGEVIFGTIIALSFLVIFAAFQFAGELISFQMGFGIAQVVDPQSGAQMTVFSSWFQLVAVLIFFSMNGHHLVLSGLVESFRTVPMGGFAMTQTTFTKVVLLSGRMFVIGIKMAAPIMTILFLTHVGLGLMSKFAPEINILIVSFPLTIVLGLLFLGLSITAWGNAMEHYLENLFHLLKGFMG
jgi:flagellar biosynthesis protein FliR